MRNRWSDETDGGGKMRRNRRRHKMPTLLIVACWRGRIATFWSTWSQNGEQKWMTRRESCATWMRMKNCRRFELAFVRPVAALSPSFATNYSQSTRLAARTNRQISTRNCDFTLISRNHASCPRIMPATYVCFSKKGFFHEERFKHKSNTPEKYRMSKWRTWKGLMPDATYRGHSSCPIGFQPFTWLSRTDFHPLSF